MTGLYWELAGCLILVELLQAIIAGSIVALLLWYVKRMSACHERVRGGPE